jgi:hypothetical protein
VTLGPCPSSKPPPLWPCSCTLVSNEVSLFWGGQSDLL